MRDMSTKKIHISEEFRTSVIAVDDYSSADFSGKLYNPFYTQCVQIRSFQQLIKELDSLMDEIGCPMSGMEKRSFTKYSHADSRAIFFTDKDHASKGKVATFAIRIQYRNNASWQGTVKWIEGDAEEYFRSVLELFWLIDSAMSADCSRRSELEVVSCK